MDPLSDLPSILATPVNTGQFRDRGFWGNWLDSPWYEVQWPAPGDLPYSPPERFVAIFTFMFSLGFRLPPRRFQTLCLQRWEIHPYALSAESWHYINAFDRACYLLGLEPDVRVFESLHRCRWNHRLGVWAIRAALGRDWLFNPEGPDPDYSIFTFVQW